MKKKRRILAAQLASFAVHDNSSWTAVRDLLPSRPDLAKIAKDEGIDWEAFDRAHKKLLKAGTKNGIPLRFMPKKDREKYLEEAKAIRMWVWEDTKALAKVYEALYASEYEKHKAAPDEVVSELEFQAYRKETENFYEEAQKTGKGFDSDLGYYQILYFYVWSREKKVPHDVMRLGLQRKLTPEYGILGDDDEWAEAMEMLKPAFNPKRKLEMWSPLSFREMLSDLKEKEEKARSKKITLDELFEEIAAEGRRK